MEPTNGPPVQHDRVLLRGEAGDRRQAAGLREVVRRVIGHAGGRGLVRDAEVVERGGVRHEGVPFRAGRRCWRPPASTHSAGSPPAGGPGSSCSAPPADPARKERFSECTDAVSDDEDSRRCE